jgi:solute carrier family 13 (sodium-dependent dicarboxylate transporter), member 2/3/5
MDEAKKPRDVKYIVHSIIGLVLMFGIPMLPPVEPITQIGMQIGGIFIGLVYLWSTVGLFWPSLIGIVAFAFTDYTDMYGMFEAFSAYLPMLMLFCMILFGAIGDCGLTRYIAHWFLKRKIINGRPSMFNFFFFLAVFAVSAIVDPLMAMLVLWPTMYIIFEEVGYEKTDNYCKIMLVASFVAVTMGQCTLPFFGGQLVILGAFEVASGIPTNYVGYIAFNVITSVIIIAAMTLLIKFVLRPDMSKMANISVEQINKEQLPPMNIQQKAYVLVTILFFIFALGPSVLPADWAITQFMNDLNLVGFCFLAIGILALIKVDGKPILEPVRICKEYVMWDLYLLVVVCVFLAGCLMADETGLREWLVGILTPVFSAGGPIFFMIAVVVIAGLVTNVANNAITGAILMQIIVAMGPVLGIENLAAVAMATTLASFLAILTPAGSPYAAVFHSNKDKISSGEILKYGSIMMVVALVVYCAIGLPLANLMF